MDDIELIVVWFYTVFIRLFGHFQRGQHRSKVGQRRLPESLSVGCALQLHLHVPSADRSNNQLHHRWRFGFWFKQNHTECIDMKYSFIVYIVTMRLNSILGTMQIYEGTVSAFPILTALTGTADTTVSSTDVATVIFHSFPAASPGKWSLNYTTNSSGEKFWNTKSTSIVKWPDSYNI